MLTGREVLLFCREGRGQIKFSDMQKVKMILNVDTFCMYFHNSTYKCIVVDPLYWRGDPLTLLLLFQYVFNVFDCLTLVRCE